MFDIDNIPLDDQEVYKNIYHKGNTWGVFQLDSPIGIRTCKNFQPSNISDIALTISIIRPGTLKSYNENGRSMTNVICDRKHGVEKNPQPPHPILEEVLKETYYINVYQETSIKLVQILAGFNGEKSDELRRGIGKKLADVIAGLEKDFLEGCKTVGLITQEVAKQVFDNIKASNRYAFNKCLSPDTLVETKGGLKSIEEVLINEEVKCPTGFKKIINKYYNGKKECVEITLSSGKKITSTLDHKFLCEDGEIRPLYIIIDKKYNIICDDE